MRITHISVFFKSPAAIRSAEAVSVLQCISLLSAGDLTCGLKLQTSLPSFAVAAGTAVLVQAPGVQKQVVRPSKVGMEGSLYASL